MSEHVSLYYWLIHTIDWNLTIFQNISNLAIVLKRPSFVFIMTLGVRDIVNKQAVLLVLLDLSAAFGAVDHCIWGSKRCGWRIWYRVWPDFHHTYRTQKVNINNEYSLTAKLKCGAPQGSELGSVLFNTYFLPLGEILRELGWSLIFILMTDNCRIPFTLMVILVFLAWKDIWL